MKAGTSSASLAALVGTATWAIRRHFDETLACEVHPSPLREAPSIDAHIDLFETQDSGRRSWLHSSPEHAMKTLLAKGVGDSFYLGHVFRQEERGPWHLPAFLMCEWYRLGDAYEHIIAETQALATRVHTSTQASLDFGVPPTKLGLEPWPRLSVTELFRDVCKADVPDDDELYFRMWVERIEPALATMGAVFVDGYPARMAALAKLNEAGDAKRFELFINGVELCNGYDELTDAAVLAQRFESQNRQRVAMGKAAYPIDESFLAALPQMPACAGNALGVERLLAVLHEADSIHAILP